MYKCHKWGFKEIIHFFLHSANHVSATPLVCSCSVSKVLCRRVMGKWHYTDQAPRHCLAGAKQETAWHWSAQAAKSDTLATALIFLKNSLFKLPETGMALVSFPYLCQKKDVPSFIKHTESHSFEVWQFYIAVLHYKGNPSVFNELKFCRLNFTWLICYPKVKSNATVRMQTTPNSKSVLCMNHNAVWIVIPWVYWLTAPWSLWVTKH